LDEIALNPPCSPSEKPTFSRLFMAINGQQKPARLPAESFTASSCIDACQAMGKPLEHGEFPCAFDGNFHGILLIEVAICGKDDFQDSR